MTSQIVEEACTNTDCDDQTHPFPIEGARVRVIERVETREPGDDDSKPIWVNAGEEGLVVGYMAEWHDVHVALATQDGQDVWLEFSNLEVIR